MDRPGLSALHFAGVGAGIALSALMIGGLDAAGLDWRAQWLASGGLTLLALLAAVRLVPPDAATPAAAPAAAGVDKNDRRMIRLVLAYGLFGFGYVITATFISTIARATPALQAVEPLVWLVVGLAAIPSSASGSRSAGGSAMTRAMPWPA